MFVFPKGTIYRNTSILKMHFGVRPVFHGERVLDSFNMVILDETTF